MVEWGLGIFALMFFLFVIEHFYVRCHKSDREMIEGQSKDILHDDVVGFIPNSEEEPDNVRTVTRIVHGKPEHI